MGTQTLTKEQEAFLEECLLEFSDRYTDADLEYKETYDSGIPTPPIMYPWYGRPKITATRYRQGGNFRQGYQEHRYENNYRDRNHHWDDRDGGRERDRHSGHYRYRPN